MTFLNSGIFFKKEKRNRPMPSMQLSMQPSALPPARSLPVNGSCCRCFRAGKRESGGLTRCSHVSQLLLREKHWALNPAGLVGYNSAPCVKKKKSNSSQTHKEYFHRSSTSCLFFWLWIRSYMRFLADNLLLLLLLLFKL